jgi:hypothetical protein
MKRSAFALVVATLILAGCVSGQTALPQNAVAHSRAHKTSGSSGDLIYAITAKGIVIVSYPTWSIYARIRSYRTWYYVCSDPNTGNVFAVATDNNEIDEYAHGGTTPIATITPPSGYGGFTACSVDPTTGNLAVVTIYTPKGGQEALLVYPQAQGNPTAYSDKQLPGFNSLAYDNAGNLFIAARDKAGDSRIGELKAGRNQFTVIKLIGNPHTFPPQIQWGGKYLVFLVPNGQGYGTTVNQVKISGRMGTIVRSFLLNHCQDAYFWIYNGALLSFYYPPRVHNDYAIAKWNYPLGGKPESRFYGLTRGRDYTYDLTVSVAPSH